MCQLQQGASAILHESALQTKNCHPKQSSLSYPDLYYDGQFDDSRLCIALACTAALAGAAVTTHTEAVKLLKVRQQTTLVVAYSLSNILQSRGVCCKILIYHKVLFCDISA